MNSHQFLFVTLKKSIVTHFGLVMKRTPRALLSLMESNIVPNDLIQCVISQFGDDTNDVFVYNVRKARKKLQQMTLLDVFLPTFFVCILILHIDLFRHFVSWLTIHILPSW